MNILLALDDSPCSKAALDSVLERPWPADTHFHVLCVVEPFHPEYAGWHTSYVPLAIEAQKERVAYCQNLVRQATDNLAGRFAGLNVSGEAVEGYIKETILSQARSWPADFIVMGSHGRQGLEKLLMGSISQAVFSGAPCSVEIVRTQKRAS